MSTEGCGCQMYSHTKALLLNHHVKKETCVSIMVVMMDLDQEPIPLNSRHCCLILITLGHVLQWRRNRSSCSGFGCYTFQPYINIHSPYFKVLLLSSLLDATSLGNNN